MSEISEVISEVMSEAADWKRCYKNMLTIAVDQASELRKRDKQITELESYKLVECLKKKEMAQKVTIADMRKRIVQVITHIDVVAGHARPLDAADIRTRLWDIITPSGHGGILSKSDAITHMENGGQVFRVTARDGRFFYKIEDGNLMCRCNELGGWHPSHAPLRDTDKLHVATLDWKIEGFGRHERVVEIPLS